MCGVVACFMRFENESFAGDAFMRRPIFFSAYPKIFNLAKWYLLGIKACKSCYDETSGVMLPILDSSNRKMS